MADGLREFSLYHRRIAAFQGMVCLAVIAALAALMREDYTWWGGFAAGAAAQMLKFMFIDIAVVKRIAMQQKDAVSTQIKAMLATLALFGLAVAGVYWIRLNVFAMAAGIFLPRLILLADSYLRPDPFGGNDAGSRAEDDAAPEDDRADAGDNPDTEAEHA